DQPEDDFASLFEAQTRGVREEKRRPLALGERVRAEVVQVGRDGVFVELLERATLGKRPQAFMHHEDVRGADGNISVKVGDVLEPAVVGRAPRAGELRPGRSMGRPAGLDELATAHAAKVAVEGKVTGVNKGGLEVEVAGVRAFCPISQADRGYV